MKRSVALRPPPRKNRRLRRIESLTSLEEAHKARRRLDLPTWIIGPALGDGPLIDRPADILKIWPARAPIERQRPAEFNSMLDRLVTGHCGLR